RELAERPWTLCGEGARPRRRTRPALPFPRLSTQSQPLRDGATAPDVGLGEVVQQPAALTHQDQQATGAVVVVLVCLEVLVEGVDATREHRHLHLGRTSVALRAAVLGDDLGLGGLVE